MPIDASIYGAVRAPEAVNPLMQYGQAMQLQGAIQGNRLSAMQLDEYARKRQDDEAMREAVKGFGPDTTANYNRLLGTGNLVGATTYQKGVTEQAKTAAEVDKTRIEAAHKRTEMLGSALGYVRDNPSLENARAAVSQLVSLGVVPPEKGQEALTKFQSNPTPEGIRAFATLGYQAALAAKDQLPKYETRNLGGTTDTLSLNPVTGKATTVNSSANTQSPDNLATNQTSRANNAANVGATIRGQDLTDARAREMHAATVTKPFEVTGPDGKPVLVQQDKQGNLRAVDGFAPKTGADKPMTDAQAKAALFGSRMEASNKILEQLAAAGTDTSVPGSRSGYGVGSLITALSPAKQQQLDQAKRDFINATLRRESGAVISDAEFENGDKQYFPQPGDSPQVKVQKAQNRAIAVRGVQAEVPKGNRGVLQEIQGTQPAAAPANIDALLKKYGGQ